jgi:hypothetical protein
MSYIGNSAGTNQVIPLPLAVTSGGTSASTIIGAKTALGIISNANDGTLVESGTTAQRGSATQYKIRFNIDTGSYEGANGAVWAGIGGGARNDVFFVNKNTVTVDTTIAAGENAMSAGPITIADGVTVTIDDNATWTVVGV